MLYTPLTNLKSKRGYFGIVTTSGRVGQIMRRLGFPVQTRSISQSQWRANFVTAKKLWLSLGTGGAGYVPTDGIYPQDAWAAMNELFNGNLFGPLQSSYGYVEALQGSCETSEAYFVMCQTVRALLGLPQAPTPQNTTSGVSSSFSTNSATVGTYNFSFGNYGPASPTPLLQQLRFIVYVTGVVTDSLTVSVTGLPTGVTLELIGNPSDFIYYTDGNYSQGVVWGTLQIAPNAAASSATATLHLVCTGASYTTTFTVAISTIASTPAYTPPSFALLLTFKCTTLYDLSYVVVGFAVAATWANDLDAPVSPAGAQLLGFWEVLASPQYTSPYAPPAASTWKPILLTGQSLPTPAGLLAAWIVVFGQLAAKGYIKFQILWLDAWTGASGPALSCTAHWQNGTLYGGTIFGGPPSSWGFNGGLYQLISGVWTLIDLFNITAPGTYTLATYVGAAGPYYGTITFTPKSAWIKPTGHNSTATALPDGVSLAISPTSVTLADPGTALTLVEFTITVAADYQGLGGTFYLLGDDGISKHAFTPVVGILDGNLPLPPASYVTLWPDLYAPDVTLPLPIVIQYVLFNTDVNSYTGSMAVSFTNPAMVGSFDVVNPVVPPQAPANLTTYPMTIQGENGNSGSTTGIFFVYGTITGDLTGFYILLMTPTPAGWNATALEITSNTVNTITVSASGFTVNSVLTGLAVITNPSHLAPSPMPSISGTWPGTAVVNLTIDTSKVTDLNPYDNAQITFNAGLDTTFAGIFL